MLPSLPGWSELHPSLPPRPEALRERHEQLGEAVRALFAGPAAAYVALLAGLAAARRRIPGWLGVLLQLAFLVGYLAALPVLLRAAALGGDLVHRWGVRGSAAAAPSALGEGNGDGAARVFPQEVGRDEAEGGGPGTREAFDSRDGPCGWSGASRTRLAEAA